MFVKVIPWIASSKSSDQKTTFCQLIYRLTLLTLAEKSSFFQSFKIMHYCSYLGRPLVINFIILFSPAFSIDFVCHPLFFLKTAPEERLITSKLNQNIIITIRQHVRRSRVFFTIFLQKCIDVHSQFLFFNRETEQLVGQNY